MAINFRSGLYQDLGPKKGRQTAKAIGEFARQVQRAPQTPMLNRTDSKGKKLGAFDICASWNLGDPGQSLIEALFGNKGPKMKIAVNGMKVPKKKKPKISLNK